MTVSQSSSLIRAISVSRVTPALLTSASISPSSASTRSTRPRPPRDGDVRLDGDAADLAGDLLGRRLVGAVVDRNARAGSPSSREIAAPIPRDPPVTRATLPSSDANAIR
jgi:hypothetical protein